MISLAHVKSIQLVIGYILINSVRYVPFFSLIAFGNSTFSVFFGFSAKFSTFLFRINEISRMLLRLRDGTAHSEYEITYIACTPLTQTDGFWSIPQV